jgi:hypothetical protein
VLLGARIESLRQRFDARSFLSTNPCDRIWSMAATWYAAKRFGAACDGTHRGKADAPLAMVMDQRLRGAMVTSLD